MAFSNAEDSYYVYGLFDPKTEELRYVGVTYRPHKRLMNHIHSSKKATTHKDHWILSLKKQQLKPLMYVFEIVNKKDVQEIEQFYICYFRSIGCRLTNATIGGDGLESPTQEVREKIRASQIGKKKNSHFSPEERQRRSVQAKNRIFSEQDKKKISEAKKGVLFSAEHKHKLSQAKIGKKRKPFTEQTLERMRLAQKKRNEQKKAESS